MTCPCFAAEPSGAGTLLSNACGAYFRSDVRYSLFDLVDMKAELSTLAGRPVDLFTLRGIEHMANRSRRESILGSLELVHAA